MWYLLVYVIFLDHPKAENDRFFSAKYEKVFHN